MRSWQLTVGLCNVLFLSLVSTASVHGQQAAPNPPYSGTYFETPQSLNCIYRLGTQVAGCNPNDATLVQSTTNLGSHAIVVVARVHDPRLQASLNKYSAQFGLPSKTVTVVTASNASTCNPGLADNDIENGTLSCYQRTTDVLEVAHALAPAAALVVVEMHDPPSASEFAAAIDTATAQAKNAGGGEVLFSQVFTEDTAISSVVEPHLQPSTANQGVLYFALAGNLGNLLYPASSPNVVAVSPSNIARDMENPNNMGAFLSHRSGNDGSGGLSTLFAAPSFQNRIATRIGNANKRALPDITTSGNDNANVWVYNTNSASGAWQAAAGPYMAVGIAAAIANASKASDSFVSTSALLTRMYAKIGTNSFVDTAIGGCGAYLSGIDTVADRNSPFNQWDFCSGIGVPVGTTGFGP